MDTSKIEWRLSEGLKEEKSCGFVLTISENVAEHKITEMKGMKILTNTF